MGRLLAGVGRATITPPVGSWLMGYASRDKESTSRHDDLVATALVLFDGETRVAIVTCDLIFLHPTTVACIREQVSARTGIPADHVMICCSHTHSGPAPFAGQQDAAVRNLHSSYVDNLVHLVAGAVTEANHDLHQAAWGVGRGKVAIGINRRQPQADGSLILGENPLGAVDTELVVLRIDALDETGAGRHPLAALANYACHAVCLSSNSYAISADWPGVMRREAEAATGAMVGLIQGACADINPTGGPQDSFDNAQNLGGMVAQELTRVHAQITLQREARLQAMRKDLRLPLLAPPVGGDGPVPTLETTFAERAAVILKMTPHEALSYLDQRFPWMAKVELESQGGTVGEGAWATWAEVQGVRMSEPRTHAGDLAAPSGDVALVGVAAEPFAEIGMEVKSKSTSRDTIFAGYANGSIGYLPTPQAYEEGGYEVDTSYIYYRLPASLSPACAGIVIGEMLSLIESMGE